MLFNLKWRSYSYYYRHAPHTLKHHWQDAYERTAAEEASACSGVAIELIFQRVGVQRVAPRQRLRLHLRRVAADVL